MKMPREITLERERKAWDLRQKCWSQERIAESLGISQAAVSQILKRLCKRFIEKHIDGIEFVKAEQLLQLEHIAFEAMQAWENSKISGNGDSRYLNTVIKAQEDIRKVLGIDIRLKAEHSAKQPLLHDYSHLTDQELCEKAYAIFGKFVDMPLPHNDLDTSTNL